MRGLSISFRRNQTAPIDHVNASTRYQRIAVLRMRLKANRLALQRVDSILERAGRWRNDVAAECDRLLRMISTEANQ